jgi:hypothetical protein
LGIEFLKTFLVGLDTDVQVSNRHHYGMHGFLFFHIFLLGLGILLEGGCFRGRLKGGFGTTAECLFKYFYNKLIENFLFIIL